VNISNQYDIGINLLVDPKALETFTKFSRQVTSLTPKMENLTSIFLKFNDTLKETSDLMGSMTVGMNDFAMRASTSFAMATREARAFNREAHGGFFGHAGRHLGSDVGRDLGTAGRLGMGGLAAAVDPLGTAAFAAVAGTAYLGVKSFKAGETLQASEGALSASGFGKAFVDKAVRDALNERIKGVSTNDYLTAVREAAAVTRDPTQSLLLAPTLAKMTVANRLLYSGEGANFSAADQLNLLRFGEIYVHGNTAKKLSEGLDLVQKIYGTEQGKIASYDLFGLARRDAAGISVMSQQGLFELVPLIQKIKGSQLGSELRTASSQFLRGQNFKTGKKAIERLMSLGVMNKEHKIMDSDLWQRSPADWVNQFLIPQYAKHGITSESAIAKEMRADFGGKIPDLLYLLYTNRAQEMESWKTGQKAFNLNQAYSVAQKLNAGAVQGASAAWTSFTAHLSILTSPTIVSGLNLLTNGLQKLINVVDWFNKHPGFTKAITAPFKSYNPIGEAYHISNSIYLDGKKIATSVSSYFSHAANAPQPSANNVSSSFVAPVPGNNFSLGGVF